MDYKDFFNEEQSAEPRRSNAPEQDLQQTSEPHAPQSAPQNAPPEPEPRAPQSTPQSQSAPPAPEPRAPQEPVRPRVYGQGAAPAGNTGYYSAPNPSYQGYVPPQQGNGPARPEPRPLGQGTDATGGGTNAYGGAPSAHTEPNPRIYAPFTPAQPSVAGAGGNTKTPLVDRKRFIVLVIVIIAAMLVSGVSGALIATNINNGGGSGAAAGSGSAQSYTIKPSSDANIAEAVAQKVLDSVVGITSKVTTSGGSVFGFDLGQQESGGVGTGMIVDERGYILTNSHVVLDGQLDTLDILLSDGTTIPGKLLWNDKSVDLAIVKIDPAGKTLKAVELGDSDKVKIGQYAAAIGNPLGLDFNSSITQGIVSGLGRSITATDGNTATTMEGLIQVDAAINSGNSGGPLLDKEGKVIGVNTAKAQAEGMGFAIPINTAKPIIDKVIKTGSFERVYMGVSAADASTIAEQYENLKIDKNLKGAFITAVSGDSPANKAGLKMKDTITKVDDKAITSSSDLIKTLLNYSAGDTVKVTYVRDGKEAVTDVKLASQEDVYGEWNNTDSNGGTSPEGSGGNGQIPVDPYGEGSEPTDPFGDW